MKKGYTFDDVALVPQFNNVPSRTEPVLDTWLTQNRKMGIPILCANMDTTISEKLGDLLIERGSVPVFHRFMDQGPYVKKYGNKAFFSCGLGDEWLKNGREYLDNGAGGVCIDVAHGHSDRMIKFIEALKSSHPESEIIAGNVCTGMAFHDLVNAGATAVKVGIGPGAACTTRLRTGFGMPQLSAIMECALIAEKLRVPLIADGGIRSSRELILALAAGASSVMIGKLFALTNESAAEKKDGKAKYRGQASADFQTDFYGGLKEMTVPEGAHFWSEVSGSANDLIDELLGGLRSGLTYGGARKIRELQRKAEFVEVTHTYAQESKTRM